MRWVKYLLSFVYPQTVEITYSEINGEIRVQKIFGHNRIVVGKHTQSGEYVADLLGKAVNAAKFSSSPKSILVWGLGGGSIIAVLNRVFPNTHITGVEIDPEMIRLGKKYLNLELTKNLNITISDAFAFVKKKGADKFDLVIINCYVGDAVPDKLESIEFLESVREILTENGVAIFNRLYFSKHREKTDDFLSNIKKIFSDVRTRKIFSNFIVFAHK